MRRLLILCLTVLIACLAGGVRAGDSSAYRFFGFSPDLKYCAFERYGTYDGSGLPYSNIYFVDVAKNVYAASPLYTEGDEDYYDDADYMERTRAENMAMAQPYFKKFGISGTNLGTRVYEVGGETRAHDVTFNFEGRDYRLVLIEKDAPGAKMDQDEMAALGWGPPQIFELDLLRSGNRRILQKDTALPKSRGGAFDYYLLATYCISGRIAVFLEYKSPGFEGPDYAQLIVTGLMN